MKQKQLESLLQQVETFDEANVVLEQYITPPAIAAQVLLNFQQTTGGIEDQVVVDLGCGTGMLSIGCALLGATSVLSVDCDLDALAIAQRNACDFEPPLNVSFVACDVFPGAHNHTPTGVAEANAAAAAVSSGSEYGRVCGASHFALGALCCDTVVCNPPFGTKKTRGADVAFLRAASVLARKYCLSFHKRSTEEHILRTARQLSRGGTARVVGNVRYNLESSMKFHKQKSVSAYAMEDRTSGAFVGLATTSTTSAPALPSVQCATSAAATRSTALQQSRLAVGGRLALCVASIGLHVDDYEAAYDALVDRFGEPTAAIDGSGASSGGVARRGSRISRRRGIGALPDEESASDNDTSASATRSASNRVRRGEASGGSGELGGGTLAVSADARVLDQFPSAGADATQSEHLDSMVAEVRGFCFPRGIEASWSRDNTTTDTAFFPFVLTNGVGQRVYAFCATRMERVPPALPRRRCAFFASRCVVIFSEHMFVDFFRELLLYVMRTWHSDGSDERRRDGINVSPPPLERLLANIVLDHRLPLAGSNLSLTVEVHAQRVSAVVSNLKTIEGAEDNADAVLANTANRKKQKQQQQQQQQQQQRPLLVLRVPPLCRYSPQFLHYTPYGEQTLPHIALLRCLGASKLLRVHAALMAERKLVFTSSHFTWLTLAAEALLSLLFPFKWYHTYIPLLPAALVDCLQAPMPFVMGLGKRYINTADVPEDVLLIDLDTGDVRDETPDESLYFPPYLHDWLSRSLAELNPPPAALTDQPHVRHIDELVDVADDVDVRDSGSLGADMSFAFAPLRLKTLLAAASKDTADSGADGGNGSAGDDRARHASKRAHAMEMERNSLVRMYFFAAYASLFRDLGDFIEIDPLSLPQQSQSEASAGSSGFAGDSRRAPQRQQQQQPSRASQHFSQSADIGLNQSGRRAAAAIRSSVPALLQSSHSQRPSPVRGADSGGAPLPSRFASVRRSNAERATAASSDSSPLSTRGDGFDSVQMALSAADGATFRVDLDAFVLNLSSTERDDEHEFARRFCESQAIIQFRDGCHEQQREFVDKFEEIGRCESLDDMVVHLRRERRFQTPASLIVQSLSAFVGDTDQELTLHDNDEQVRSEGSSRQYNAMPLVWRHALFDAPARTVLVWRRVDRMVAALGMCADAVAARNAGASATASPSKLSSPLAAKSIDSGDVATSAVAAVRSAKYAARMATRLRNYRVDLLIYRAQLEIETGRARRALCTLCEAVDQMDSERMILFFSDHREAVLQDRLFAALPTSLVARLVDNDDASEHSDANGGGDAANNDLDDDEATLRALEQLDDSVLESEQFWRSQPRRASKRAWGAAASTSAAGFGRAKLHAELVLWLRTRAPKETHDALAMAHRLAPSDNRMKDVVLLQRQASLASVDLAGGASGGADVDDDEFDDALREFEKLSATPRQRQSESPTAAMKAESSSPSTSGVRKKRKKKKQAAAVNASTPSNDSSGVQDPLEENALKNSLINEKDDVTAAVPRRLSADKARANVRPQTPPRRVDASVAVRSSTPSATMETTTHTLFRASDASSMALSSVPSTFTTRLASAAVQRQRRMIDVCPLYDAQLLSNDSVTDFFRAKRKISYRRFLALAQAVHLVHDENEAAQLFEALLWVARKERGSALQPQSPDVAAAALSATSTTAHQQQQQQQRYLSASMTELFVAQLATHVQTALSVSPSLSLAEGEFIVKHTAASNERGKRGHLILTSHRILFIPNRGTRSGSGGDAAEGAAAAAGTSSPPPPSPSPALGDSGGGKAHSHGGHSLGIEFESIAKVERYNFTILIPPGLPCIRIHLAAADEKPALFCILPEAERALWLRYMRELLGAVRVAADLSEPAHVHCAAHRLVMCETLFALQNKRSSTTSIGDVSNSRLPLFNARTAASASAQDGILKALLFYEDDAQHPTHRIKDVLDLQGRRPLLNVRPIVSRAAAAANADNGGSQANADPLGFSAKLVELACELLRDFGSSSSLVPAAEGATAGDANGGDVVTMVASGALLASTLRVNAVELLASDTFKSFESAIGDLASLQCNALASLSDAARVAFFVNLHNTMFTHGLLMAQMPTCEIDWLYFGQHIRYEVGDCVLSLDDILHGLLRGNSSPPLRNAREFSAARGDDSGAPLTDSADDEAYFAPDDVRLTSFGVPERDARIHFALCTHTRRSPPMRALRFRTSDALEVALRECVHAYCNEWVTVNVSDRSIVLPHVFGEYQSDFACEARARRSAAVDAPSTMAVLQWIADNATQPCTESLQALLSNATNGEDAALPIKVRFSSRSFQFYFNSMPLKA